MSDKSCKERIPDELDKTIESMRKFLVAKRWIQDNDLDEEEDVEEIAEEVEDTGLDPEDVLSFELKRVVKIQLSWGGPADFIMVSLDDDNDVESAEYHFQDWFDGASLDVTGRDLDILKDWLDYSGYLENI